MSQRLTTSEFIDRATRVHGEKFLYSKVEYKNAHTKIILECTEHGEFSVRARDHLRENGGCPECKKLSARKKHQMPLPVFIERAIEVHGEEYDYSCINELTNQRTKISIIHLRCGKKFEMAPFKHLYGQGCPDWKCISDRALPRVTTKQFIQKAISIHGTDHYDYSKTNYTKAKSTIDIFCNYCEREFVQVADKHLSGRGCKECARQITNLGDYLHNIKEKGIEMECTLYVLCMFDEAESFYKVGITTKTLHERYAFRNLPYDYDVIMEIPLGLIRSYEEERLLLNKFSTERYLPKQKFGGHTECLSINPIENDERLKELAEQYSDLD